MTWWTVGVRGGLSKNCLDLVGDALLCGLAQLRRLERYLETRARKNRATDFLVVVVLVLVLVVL